MKTKLIFILLIIGVFMILPFVNASITRNLGTTITSGGSTPISYTASISPWGVEELLPLGFRIRTSQSCTTIANCDYYIDSSNYLFDCISGYCTVLLAADGTSRVYSMLPGVSSLYLTANGVAAGVYTIGPSHYQVGTTETGNVPSAQITVTGNCTPTGCTCATSTCVGQYCTDCSTQCAGTKTDGSCSTPPPCTSVWTCGPWSNSTNSCGTQTCTDSVGCASPKTETKSCEPTTCDFYQKRATDGTCEFNVGLLIIVVIGLIALKFLMPR